ncbi:MAG: DUF4264 family protein [Thermoanaerobacteraceae bacterium]|nr:DUF4264 family protein [Thermoanaerobacteraceae bacterium]
MSEEKLVPFATKTFPASKTLYEIVDFLNKNLKDKSLMFGVNKNQDTMTISIYKLD